MTNQFKTSFDVLNIFVLVADATCLFRYSGLDPIESVSVSPEAPVACHTRRGRGGLQRPR